jgi:hypothetical protein
MTIMARTKPSKLGKRYQTYLDARLSRADAQALPKPRGKGGGAGHISLTPQTLSLVDAEIDALANERRALKRLRKAIANAIDSSRSSSSEDQTDDHA